MNMDSLGKIVDILILIIVLFFFPVRWALTQAENTSGEKLLRVADECLAGIENTGYIDYEQILFIEAVVSKVGNHHMDIEISRFDGSIITMKEIIDSKITFKSADMIFLKLYDDAGPFYTTARRIP